MMGQPLYGKVQQLCQITLQTKEVPQLERVSANPVTTLGHAEVVLVMASARLQLWLVHCRERPNFVIGAAFFCAHNCDLSLHQRLFTIGEQQVKCMTPHTLPEGTCIKDVYPATSLKQTCEMFGTHPQLSDWDSDDNELFLC